MIIPTALKLRHIQAFLSVADHGSVSAAARDLHVSQPALSKTIADTEACLGTQLFDRSGRRMTLTPSGTLFRRHARAALASLESGIDALNGQSAPETLSVGVLPTVTGTLFPAVAQAFTQTRPGTLISVVTGPHSYLLERLRAGTIELMIGRMPSPAEMAGLRFEFLYEDRIDLVARAGHPLLGTDPAQALRHAPVILPNRQAIIRQIVEGFLNARGLSDLRPALETVSLDLALPLMQQADMLWFISQSVVARDIDAGHLARFDLGAGFMTGAIGITLPTSRDTSSNANYLIEVMREKAITQRPIAD